MNSPHDDPVHLKNYLSQLVKAHHTEKQSHLQQIQSLKHQLSIYKNKNIILKRSLNNLDSENNRLVGQMDQYQLANINFVEGLEEFKNLKEINKDVVDLNKIREMLKTDKKQAMKEVVAQLVDQLKLVQSENQKLFKIQQGCVIESKINYQRFKEYEEYRQLLKKYSFKELDKLLKDFKNLQIKYELAKRNYEEQQQLTNQLKSENQKYKVKLFENNELLKIKQERIEVQQKQQLQIQEKRLNNKKRIHQLENDQQFINDEIEQTVKERYMTEVKQEQTEIRMKELLSKNMQLSKMCESVQFQEKEKSATNQAEQQQFQNSTTKSKTDTNFYKNSQRMCQSIERFKNSQIKRTGSGGKLKQSGQGSKCFKEDNHSMFNHHNSVYSQFNNHKIRQNQSFNRGLFK